MTVNHYYNRKFSKACTQSHRKVAPYQFNILKGCLQMYCEVLPVHENIH